MSKLSEIATQVEELSAKLDRADKILAIAMEHLNEEQPVKDDIPSIIAFINRFDFFYALLETVRDITFSTAKEVYETAEKLCHIN